MCFSLLTQGSAAPGLISFVYAAPPHYTPPPDSETPGLRVRFDVSSAPHAIEVAMGSTVLWRQAVGALLLTPAAVPVLLEVRTSASDLKTRLNVTHNYTMQRSLPTLVS